MSRLGGLRELGSRLLLEQTRTRLLVSIAMMDVLGSRRIERIAFALGFEFRVEDGQMQPRIGGG